jgi:hypothetical protein
MMEISSEISGFKKSSLVSTSFSFDIEEINVVESQHGEVLDDSAIYEVDTARKTPKPMRVSP